MRRRTFLEIDLDTGVVLLELHRLDQRLHRDPKEGPACVRREPGTGIVVEERYYWHGRLHRDGQPAVITYNQKSVPIVEMYYRHGLMHRDPKEGPARIERNRTGSLILIESYCLYDKLYRDPADGPNQIERREDGSVDCVSYSAPDDVRPTRSSARQRSGSAVAAKPVP